MTEERETTTCACQMKWSLNQVTNLPRYFLNPRLLSLKTEQESRNNVNYNIKHDHPQESFLAILVSNAKKNKQAIVYIIFCT